MPPPGLSALLRNACRLGRNQRCDRAFGETCGFTCRLGESCAFTGGGGERDRTDDLLLAKQALSQLSYTPFSVIRDP